MTPVRLYNVVVFAIWIHKIHSVFTYDYHVPFTPTFHHFETSPFLPRLHLWEVYEESDIMCADGLANIIIKLGPSTDLDSKLANQLLEGRQYIFQI